MIRTQISLDKHEYARTKAAAKARGISIAEFVRRAIRDALPTETEGRPWMKFAGMLDSGDPHSSRNIDEIVYGHKE